MNPQLCNWTIVKKLGFGIRATYLEKISGDWNWLNWKRRIMIWFRHVFKYRRQWSLIRQHFLVETEEILLELHSEGFRPVCLFRLSFSSVAQSCPTLCDPMDCNMPGLSVHHQLLELPQTHVHWVGDAIQPSHPLSSPSPAVNLSQRQGLF